ncbi:MAG: response regulator transcription factor [Solirubrobacteraceae bacterium]|nr:response regulator transcription factor [Solirubrobacteraceae bacterium]
MTQPHVLVVDDEPDVRSLVRLLLERAGYHVSEAVDGRAALRHIFSEVPDLVLLDVTMPDIDGWQTLQRIRDVTDVPVIMLTAASTELEKVRGLKSGADDYVTKPFGRQELLARIDAILRRSVDRDEDAPQAIDDGLVAIDPVSAAATVKGTPVHLTPLEFRLLHTLVRHPGEVIGRDRLLELVWGNDRAAPEQVKLYVGYLRRKLEGVMPADEVPIETVRGFGYRYLGPGVPDAEPVAAAVPGAQAAAAPAPSAAPRSRFADPSPNDDHGFGMEPGGIL